MPNPPIWRELDPTRARTGPAETTYYVPDRVLVTGRDRGEQHGLLDEVAAQLGWELVPDERIGDGRETGTLRSARPESAVTRLLIVPRPGGPEPDAFALVEAVRSTRRQEPLGPDRTDLQRGSDGAARRRIPGSPLFGRGDREERPRWDPSDPVSRIRLDHAVFLSAFHPNPKGVYGTNPKGVYGTNPKGVYGTNGFAPSDSYVLPGEGGRSPVTVVLDAPDRGPDPRRGRRVAIGFVDSGCGAHPWLTDVRCDAPAANGSPVAPASALRLSPEDAPDQHGPLDGVLDDISGHGTFIAGVLRQTAPRADLYSWRVADGTGVMAESELVEALEHIADLVELNRKDPTAGVPLDVLSLSFGFYPERPEDVDDTVLAPSVARFAALGVAVVMSAGNESTDRPMYPAALAAHHLPGAPVLAIGARNPNGSIALFSNVGDWVSHYERGAAIVSTSPPFDGGMQPLARVTGPPGPDGVCRETLDPDCFVGLDPERSEQDARDVGGFAVWSGTSFAAPRAAGLLAAAIEQVGAVPAIRGIEEVRQLRLRRRPTNVTPDGGVPGLPETSSPEEAAKRAWQAVEAVWG